MSNSDIPASHSRSALGAVRDWCRSILKSGEHRISVRCIRQGWGTLQKGCSLEGRALRVGGHEYTSGFGTHADSEIELQSNERMTRFGAVAGVDQNKVTLAGAPQLLFSIEAEGREIWRSAVLSNTDEGVIVDLKLPPEVRTLTLRARSSNGSTERAHADWALVWIELDNGERVELGHQFSPLPFSFEYGEHSSSELLLNWPRTVSSRQGSRPDITEHHVIWTDPGSLLECRLELKEFAEHPAVEWVLRFCNRGSSDTPILKNIQALDVDWKVQSKAPELIEARLYRSRGSAFKISDFEYQEDRLLAGEEIRMIAGEGRSSQNWLPFFNIDTGDLGIITAIGWSGQWASQISHLESGRLCVRAGMETTHLKLHPGEEIRSPGILQLFWKGDRIEGHNALRRFLLNHHTPHFEGKPVPGPFTIAHWGGMRTQDQLERLAIYKRERLSQEYLWVDAGWYGLNSSCSPDEFLGDWGAHTGDWRVNPKAHPDGLKPLSDAAKDAGMKFMLWVEPERAVKGTLWPEQHPDWFLGNGRDLLLNLGNPEALRGAIELLSNLIREHNISLYREDFNIDPLAYWKANDAPDRQGMTEIRFTEGLYALWDALLELHPGLIIDNCASGGRRIDLETIGRSIVLWRSDVQCYPDCDPEAAQAQGIGLSHWIPLHGTGTYASMPTRELCSTYRARSTMGPAFQFAVFPRESNPIQEDYPWNWHRKMSADYLRMRPFYAGDYYPLTDPLATGSFHWAGYQMNRPDLSGGFIMVFRRKDAPWAGGSLKLRGLDPGSSYKVEDADTNEKQILSGTALLNGFEVALPEPESSALFFYRIIDK